MATLNNLPDLSKAVTQLADDVQKIMVSLYDFQKTLDGSNTPVISNVRRELKDQWEMLRAYLQRCHGFGADVDTLKDALGEESKNDLLEFLKDMTASAEELRDISGNLKRTDMSVAFSKGGKPAGSAKDSNLSATKGIQNDNLKAFIAALVGATKHISLSEIDAALSRIKLDTGILFQFWDDTSKGCATLVREITADRVGMTSADAERVTNNWSNYQEAIEKAILSVTKTADAILVEGAPNTNLLISAPPTVTAVHGAEKGTVGPRFGLGTHSEWWKFWRWGGN